MRSALERLYRRMQQVVGFGKVTAPPNDAGPAMMLQFALNNISMRDGVPYLGNFGLSAPPPVGSDVVTVCLAGDPSNGLVVASNHQGLRPRNLKPGETILYNAFSLAIKLDQTAGIVMTANDLAVLINGAALVFLQAPSTIATGNLVVGAGASGSFTTPLGQVVTVQDGIIINIF